MKKLSLIALVLFLSKGSFGQIEKGRYVLGANILGAGYIKNQYSTSYSNPNYSAPELTTKYFNGSISPFVGKFLANNFLVAVGVSASATTNKSESKDKTYYSKQRSQGYGLSTFTKYFFGDSQEGRPYLGLSMNAGIGPSKIEGENSNSSFHTTATVKNFNTAFSGGYAIFLNDSFMLNFDIGYHLSRVKEVGSSDEASSTDFTRRTKTSGLFFGIEISTTFSK